MLHAVRPSTPTTTGAAPLPELGVVPPPLGSTWGITDSGASRPPHTRRSRDSLSPMRPMPKVQPSGPHPLLRGRPQNGKQVLYNEQSTAFKMVTLYNNTASVSQRCHFVLVLLRHALSVPLVDLHVCLA